VFTREGAFEIVLVVTDAIGREVTLTREIAVGPPPIVAHNAALLANGTSLQSIHQNGGSRNTPIDGTTTGRAAAAALNTWNRTEWRHWFQLTFADPVTIYAVNVMWANDGGGTQPPRSMFTYPWAAGFPTQTGIDLNGFRVPSVSPPVPMVNGAGDPRPTFPAANWTPLLPLVDRLGNDLPEITNNRNGVDGANNVWNFAGFLEPVTTQFLGMEVNRAGNGIGLNQWQAFAMEPVNMLESINITVPFCELAASVFPAVHDTKMQMIDFSTASFSNTGAITFPDAEYIIVDGQIHLRWAPADIAIALAAQVGDTVAVTGLNNTLRYALTVNLTVAPPLPTYEVTFDVEGAGTIEQSEDGQYKAGARLPILAVPSAGYQFVNWLTTAGEFEDAYSAATVFVVPEGGAEVTAVFERIPITSIMIDALPLFTVARGSVHTFALNLNEGALDVDVEWQINNPLFATVEIVEGEAVVTVGNVPGMAILMATDPVSGLRHAITLRIV